MEETIMKTYTYNKNREMMQRALKVIPSGVYGHLGPGEGCMIPTDAFPFFASRAEGTCFWDLDGNRFIDYMCAYGPNIMGYNDKDVDQAAQEQFKLGNCTTVPSSIMVEFAELLTATVKKDWAFFAKNGGDVTLFSTMIARFYTGKKKIIFINGYYHGVAPWTQRADSPGVLPEECVNSIYIDFNDVEALKKVVAEDKDIACLIATPYMHGNFKDNVLPEKDYWKQVREICTKAGIILIFDDVRCGFRLDLAGSDHYYGIEADLICFCKALANGYNMSALCGKEFLKSAVSTIMYTGSYWMSAVPFAAGIANIKKMIALNTPKFLREQGLKLTKGFQKIAKENGVQLSVSGEPALFYLLIKDDNSLILHQQWIAECVKRGLFLTNHHNHFINMAVTDEIINETLDIANEAMKVMVKNNPQVYK
jgi:glutamate-1-semialdehyde 2,1-aminomutase